MWILDPCEILSTVLSHVNGWGLIAISAGIVFGFLICFGTTPGSNFSTKGKIAFATAVSFFFAFYFVQPQSPSNFQCWDDHCQKSCEILNNDQFSIVGIVIALAGYIGAIQGVLRQRRKTKDENKKRTINKHLSWLVASDFMLVLLGISLILRIACWSQGKTCPAFDQFVMALFVVNIIYPILLHARMWWIYLKFSFK